MSEAPTITGGDLARALGDAAALPAVDAAMKTRAEATASKLAGEGVTTRVLKRADGAYSVEVSGEGLFEREFGSTSTEADPAIAAAIAEARAG